ncbi:MAG: SH3 domain-containing protein [Acidobacteriota bacterium]
MPFRYLSWHPAHLVYALMALLIFTGQLACSKSSKLDDGVVISDRAEMFSSTALVNSKVGQLQKGDTLAIYHRAEVNGVEWLKVQKEGESKVGWVEARHVVSRKLLDACLALDREYANVQPQITGRLKRETRLRVQPRRDADVITVLKSGTEFDVLKRQRVERRVVSADETAPTNTDETDVKYDSWYLVRFPEASIYRIGWLYGGSVELIEPPAIAGIIGSGRRMVGVIPFGVTLDKSGTALSNYFILDKQIFSQDPVADFDRIYVVCLDVKSGNYRSAYYELPVRGVYPVTYQNDSHTEASFVVTLFDKSGNPTQVEYKAELVNNLWTVRKNKLPRPPSKQEKS